MEDTAGVFAAVGLLTIIAAVTELTSLGKAAKNKNWNGVVTPLVAIVVAFGLLFAVASSQFVMPVPGLAINIQEADIGTLIPGAQVDAFIQNDHLRLCLFEDGWEPVQEHKQGRRFGKHKERHVTNGLDSQFFQFRLPERGADKMLRASGWITDGDEAVLKFHEGQNARPFLLCGIGIGGSETEKENAFRSQIVAESGGSVVHWRGFMFGMKLPPLRRQHFG